MPDNKRQATLDLIAALEGGGPPISCQMNRYVADRSYFVADNVLVIGYHVRVACRGGTARMVDFTAFGDDAWWFW